MCTMRLRHKDRTARCRFFVVWRDGPVLLGMPDTEQFDILHIICEEVRGQQAEAIWFPDNTTIQCP